MGDLRAATVEIQERIQELRKQNQRVGDKRSEDFSSSPFLLLTVSPIQPSSELPTARLARTLQEEI